MGMLGKIAGCVLRRSTDVVAEAIGVIGVKQAVAWAGSAVVSHFTSRATELTDALRSAHQQAWGVLAFSLGDDSALDLLRSPDSRHLREQMRQFLSNVAVAQHPDASATEFRARCLIQLKAAKSAGLLADGGIDMGELCRHMGTFAAIGNSARILDAERGALIALVDEFPANQYPDLRKLLELSPGNAPPFLIVAAEFFFKRQIAANEQLARVVNHDLITVILQDQRSGFAQVVGEVQQQGEQLMAQLHLLRRELRPADSCSIHDESERRLVRSLLKKFRDLPAELQKALPDQLDNLGRLAFAAGEFADAREACAQAARSTPADSAKAQAHHNAYLAALEARDWTGALEALRLAAQVDPERFMPFPFEKYLPSRILGAGGFGVAFLCHHQYLAGQVVVKTLQTAQLSRSLQDVFREAAVLEALQHPGIVRVRDAAYADSGHTRPYLVMDWFDGQSLDDQVKTHGLLPLEQAVQLARQLAEALGAAHEKGILHRDVKPRNVLVRIEGGNVQTKLIDFGLAVQHSAARTVASGNTLLGSSQAGTLEYAAPEQMGKLPGVKIGPYSDVHAWARTVYFAMFDTPIPDYDELCTLPDPLNRLLNDCVKRQANLRPQSMSEVLNRLSATPAPALGKVVPPASKPSAPRTFTNSIDMQFVRIEPGMFLMGSPEDEEEGGHGEHQHRVWITNRFYLAVYPVTQEQYQMVMGNNPSRFTGNRNLPVEQVSWDDAVAFCKKLSQGEVKRWRLPTEAEWEYACRAGTTTPYYTGVDERALGEAGWYCGNSASKTHPVGQKKPNAWGLCDMHGNVWEWCADWYGDYGDYLDSVVTDPIGAESGTSRVVRGGSWNNDPRNCRAASRRRGTPGVRGNLIGFRLALDFH